MYRRSARLYPLLFLLAALASPKSLFAQYGLVSDAPVLPSTDPIGCPIRFTLRQDIGEHIGYDQSLTQLGMFLPLSETGGEALTFLDLQPTFYNDDGFGINAGLGYRFYSPAHERTYGVYGYLDYRDTQYSSFRQLTLGFDSLGSLIDLRGNVYLPNQGGQPLPLDAVRTPHFVRHQLRMGGYEYGMLGGDLEVGLVLPEVLNTQSRLLAGVYAFDTRGDEEGTGFRARIETHWAPWLATDVAVYHDDQQSTTVVASVELSWQPEVRGRWSPRILSMRRGPQRHITRQAADRLAEPVRRLPNIAVGRAAYVAEHDDHAWQFIHVVEGAVGGDGTFEKPFGTLEEAMAAAGPNDIVYTPFGGTYQPAQMLTVPDSVQLLSPVNEHWLSTQHGMLLVPYSGESTTPVVIQSSISLGSGTTVRGFEIAGVADTLDGAGMVRAIGRSDILFVDNQVQSLREGLWIENSDNVSLVGNHIEARYDAMHIQGGSQIDVSNNRVASTEGNGIYAGATNGITVTDNDVTGAAGSGVLLSSVDGAWLHSNQIGTVAGSGIEMQDTDNATVWNNTVAEAGRDGIEVAGGDNLQISENRVTAAARHGIGVDTTGDVQIFGNRIIDADQSGILVANAAEVAISENQIVHSGDHGIAAQGTGATQIDHNLVTSTDGDGIHVAGSVSAHIANNALGETAGDGIAASGTETIVVQENEILRAHGRGVHVEDFETADIGDNQVHWTFGDAFRIAGVDEANVTNNQVLFAGGHGFSVIDTSSIVLRNNTLKEAIGDGIFIHDGSRPVDWIVELSGNEITQAQTGIRIELAGDFFGTVSENTVSENREYGMVMQVGSLLPQLDINSNPTPSVIEANQFHYNALEGLALEVAGAGDSVVQIRNNEFILNNENSGVQGREFVTSLTAGAGPLTVDLDDNQSYNDVPLGEFNYDFLNASGSTLLYQITEPNHGTVGSSDGSVPAP